MSEKLTLKQNVSKTLAKVKFFGNKNAPELLLIGGLIGIVISEIGIGIAATKVTPINKKAKKNLNKIHMKADVVIDGEQVTGEVLDPEFNEKKELTKVYALAGLEYVKLFGPFVLTTVASFAVICKSHSIMKDRNIQLAAAYTILDSSFREYRKRVANKFGEEAEYNIRNNVQDQLSTTIAEDGTEVVTVVGKSGDWPTDEMFGFFFKEGCYGWSKNSLYNKDFVIGRERWWKALLQVNEYVTVNDIRKDFGKKPTKAGAMWGWKKEANGTEPTTIIDFGLFDKSPLNSAFLEGDSTDCFISLKNVTYIFNDFEGDVKTAQFVVDPGMKTYNASPGKESIPVYTENK